MRTSSPDSVHLRKVMLHVEELILAFSSSMCPSRSVVVHILMTFAIQTLLVPARRYARTLRLMLTCARQRNILPARSRPCGLAKGPNSEAPPPSEHPMPVETDNIPLAHPIYQQPTEPDSSDHIRDHQQAQSYMIPTSGMQSPYTSSELLDPPSSIHPFETETHSTLFEHRSFEGGE